METRKRVATPVNRSSATGNSSRATDFAIPTDREYVGHLMAVRLGLTQNDEATYGIKPILTDLRQRSGSRTIAPELLPQLPAGYAQDNEGRVIKLGGDVKQAADGSLVSPQDPNYSTLPQTANITTAKTMNAGGWAVGIVAIAFLLGQIMTKKKVTTKNVAL